LDQQLLARVLKEGLKSGKFTLGTREVLSDLKTSKVVIAATPLLGRDADKLRMEAEANKIPLISTGRNSALLGRLVGRPYKVSAIALRSISDQDLRQLQE